MSKTIKSEELNASITLPDPFLMRHWDAYWEARGNNDSRVSSLFAGAMAIIEGGEYTVGEKTHNLKAVDPDDVPTNVASWIAAEVDYAVAAVAALPKDWSGVSSEPPKRRRQGKKT